MSKKEIYAVLTNTRIRRYKQHHNNEQPVCHAQSCGQPITLNEAIVVKQVAGHRHHTDYFHVDCYEARYR